MCSLVAPDPPPRSRQQPDSSCSSIETTCNALQLTLQKVTTRMRADKSSCLQLEFSGLEAILHSAVRAGRLLYQERGEMMQPCPAADGFTRATFLCARYRRVIHRAQCIARAATGMLVLLLK